MTKINGQVSRLIRMRWIQHLVFWGVSFMALLHVFTISLPVKSIDLIYPTVFLISLVIPVYLNFFLLIPVFLSGKKYLLYIASITMTLIAGTGLNLLVFDRLIDYIFPDYYFIDYYGFFDVLKFFIVFIGLTTLLKLSKGWFALMETKSRMEQLEREKALSELEALRNQVQPHFFFNSLNSIYALAMRKSDLAPEVILKLSGFMRYLIYEAGNSEVPLEKEIACMHQYFELQRLRSDHPSGIMLTVEGDHEAIRVAPLLFLPLLENSFKHGDSNGTGVPDVSAILQITIYTDSPILHHSGVEDRESRR